MTRKLLSGVLAFAMVFGCTAPVALAEDTTVEEVEQYANYLPELSATSIKMTSDDSETVKVNGINETLIVTPTDDYETISAKYDAATQTIKVTTTKEFGETGADVVLHFTVTSANEKDFIANEGKLTLTVKRTAPDAVVADAILLDGYTVSNGATGSEKLTVGKPVKFLVQAGAEGATTAKAKPYSLTYRITTGGSAFVSVSTADKKDDDGKVIGTEVTLTGLKKTSSTDNVKIEFSAKALSTSTTTVATFAIDVVNPVEATALTLKADKTEIVKETGVAQLVAQAYGTDEYGDNVALDGSQNLQWSVNGYEMKDGKVKVTNGLGETIATLSINTTNDGVAEFSAKEPGAYRIIVTDEAGNYSAAKTVTVIAGVTKTAGTTFSYTDDIKKSETINVAAKAGSTVDFSGVKYGAVGNDNVAYPVSAFGGEVTLKVAAVTADKAYGKDIAAKVATIKDGVVTIADETNATMAELLKLAGDDPVYITVLAAVKYSATDTENVELTIRVTKPSDEIDDHELYANGKLVDYSTHAPTTYVMTVGKPVDFDLKVMDDNGFTDGIDQGVIWSIENGMYLGAGIVLPSDDDTVYATVDAKGVVTPLAKCSGKAVLRFVSTADTSINGVIQLYIMEDPNATVAPTEKPTEAPTQAPETKTGTVNTSSSALNIRAAASTTAGVVTKAAKGSTVTILGEENGFYKVKLADGTIGYASKAYIKVVTDTPVVTITATTTANLKLRTSAPSGSVITVMPKGATVKVIEGGQSWAKVEYNGKVGYASNNYLTFNTVG